MTDEHLQEHAFTILARELGLADYARFLRLLEAAKGDYTADRQKWQASTRLEDILQQLKEREVKQT